MILGAGMAAVDEKSHCTDTQSSSSVSSCQNCTLRLRELHCLSQRVFPRRDAKVRKSVERIFSIWEERNVYPEELITELKTSLVKKEPAVSAPVNPKSALKSKIVAEFAPQAFIEQLSAYQRSVEEVELKEKQLSALRVDVCSTETLKRLKDKAGGKKFSKDFEDGNAKLEEFVSFLETQVCSGPKLIDALENADVFYEMQYKEVKIVANAYKTFANRVNNLKRKLDVLKASLPDPEDSPIPSPSEDAPSPTGSESPFHGMGRAEGDPDIDGQAMDEPEGGASPLSSASPPTHSADNRDVQDMELSEEEETESANIIVEERREKPAPAESSPAPVSRASEAPAAKQVTPPVSASPARTPGTPGTPSHPLPVNLANVDLGKISSILSSLTSVMKSTGVSPVSRPSPGTPGTPTPHGAVLKPPPPAAGPPANPLASILSRVDITPESILSALSKTQGQTTGLQGLSSLLHSVAGNSSHNAGAAGGVPNSGKERPAPPAGANQAPRGHSGPSQSSPTPTPAPADAAAASSSSSSSSSGPAGKSAPSASAKHKLPARSGYRSARDSERERERAKEREREPPVPAAPTSSSSSSSSSSPSSLEMKIHKFLQGNPGFSALNLNIPILGGAGGGTGSPSLPVAQGNSCPDFGHLRLPPPADNVDGTPVRDERGATPTQDEMMDKPAGVETMSLLSKILSPGSSSTPGSSTRSPLSAAAPGNPGRAGTVCSSSGSSAPAALPPPSSSSSSSSSYKAFGQGGRDLSPTAYRGGDSWEKPDFSEALPAAGSFYPRDASGFGEAEDEYPGFGGPPTSALFNLDKKPAKSILKSSAGGGGRAPEDHRRKSGVSSSSSSSAAVSAAASSPHAAPADSLTAAPHKPRERTKEGYPFGEGVLVVVPVV
nr:PREDICTED: regulation of nuclear pre-mRNA domain-containing protein 2 [Lepisosteus oculatus]